MKSVIFLLLFVINANVRFPLEAAELTREQVIEQSRDKSHKLDLKKKDLSGLDLSEMDLSGADLFSANLDGSKLGGANLKGATLDRAQLRKASFIKADLTSASLYAKVFVLLPISAFHFLI